MHVLSRSAAAVGAAALLAVVVPFAAQADPAPYTPLKPDPWSASIASCSSLTRQIPAHTFDSNVALTLSVSGASASPTFAMFTAAQVSKQITSSSDGGAAFSLDFGHGAGGVYNVNLVEPGTQNAAYGTVTVTAACGAVDPKPVAAGLAKTGTTIDYRTLWGAGVAAGLGVVLWAVAAVRRRPRSRRR
ncbi:hypothetical protein [Gryllotalpicola protaetiae]|nr:hypothetical protein [Gryllotalpicola protaetiae]